MANPNRLALLLVLVPTTLLTQAPTTRLISGVIVDSAGVPVAHANVVLPDGRRVVATAEGRFALGLEQSVRTLEFRRIGFHPYLFRFAAIPDTALRIVLVPFPQTLQEVRVVNEYLQSLRSRGFYERMADVERGINRGFFITPEELESRKGSRITDFLHGRHGVKVRMVKEPGVVGRSGLLPLGIDGCRMEIYLDGARFYPLSFNMQTLPTMSGMNFINDVVPIATVAGIEVYPRGVQAPPKYQPLNGTCGVILIWTR